jgi:hypothetical protein
MEIVYPQFKSLKWELGIITKPPLEEPIQKQRIKFSWSPGKIEEVEI